MRPYVVGGLLLLAVAACAGSPPARSREPSDTIPLDSLRHAIVAGRASFTGESRAIPGFGGTYFEPPCTRVVLVTDPGPAVDSAARAFYASKPEGCQGGRLRVRKARYRWEELQRWFYDEMWLSDLFGLTAGGVSVVRNRIVIGVADTAALRAVERRLTRIAVPREAILLAVTGPRPSAHGLELRVGVLDLDRRPVAGVRAEVFREGECIRVVTTDSTGLAPVDSLNSGTYSVRVVGPRGTVAAFVPLPGQAHTASVVLDGERPGDNTLRFVLLPFEDWPEISPSPFCGRGSGARG
jgi:hypothetical protein